MLSVSQNQINSNFDAIVIGAGGLLGINLLGRLFKDPDSWSRLKIPIIALGIGTIKNHPSAKVGTDGFHHYNRMHCFADDKMVDGCAPLQWSTMLLLPNPFF